MAKKTFAEQAHEFEEKVIESKIEQEETNKELTPEEEAAKRKEFIEVTWKDLPELDKYLINVGATLREVSRKGIELMSQQGRDFLALLYGEN